MQRWSESMASSTMAEKVTLHGRRLSPFTVRVIVALKMKGVEHEYVEEDDFENKSPELLRYNPIHKKVPVLVHGGKVVLESQVIIEYIDETWDSGAPILPRDPYQRAHARFWARFIDDKLNPPIFSFLFRGQEEAKEEALQNLKILDKELEGKTLFSGESIGFLDLVANVEGYWVATMEEAAEKVLVTEEAFPSLCKWRDEFVSRSLISESLPPRGEIVSYFRGRMVEAGVIKPK